MSKRDFFRIIVKLFGLYCLILTLFQYVPTIFQFSVQGFDLWSGLWVLGLASIVIGLYLFLLTRPDAVINWLKLDKGFDDERIEMGNFNSVNLVAFATILIGGFLIVDYFPSFIHNCYLAFKERVETKGMEGLMDSFEEKTQYFNWAISAMNIIIG